jgi:hypothetical protein
MVIVIVPEYTPARAIGGTDRRPPTYTAIWLPGGKIWMG